MSSAMNAVTRYSRQLLKIPPRLRGRCTCTIACFALLLSGCGGGRSVSSVTTGSGLQSSNPPEVVQITVTPDNVVVPIAQSTKFTATATYSDGRAGDISGSASWSSNSAQIAQVNGNGNITCQIGGAIQVTVTAGTVSGNASAACVDPGAFYIAPDGSDGSVGSITAPFATLGHARDVARQTQGATIYLRAGTYFLADALQLDQRDSGTTWMAFPGEQVAVSGGTPLTGWMGPDAQGRWTAHTNLENFRQLYVNGRRAARSRMMLTNPSLVVSSDTITGSAGFVIPASISAWKNPTDMELGLFGSYNAWTQSICEVQSVVPASAGTLVTLQNPCFYLARHKPGIQVSTATYLENAIELLAPGQFYFDRPNHTVYYIPLAGEDVPTATVIAPRLQTLLTITGSIDQPATGLELTNIIFENTSWLGTSSSQGFPEIQAAFRASAGGPNSQYYEKTPGGLILAYTKNSTFERCSFAHMGGSGIDIQTGSTGNVISGATVSDISANGIQIGDVQANDYAPSDPLLIVKGNTVSNSYIHDTGVEYTGAVGIFVGYTSETKLVHNEVTHLPYTGISMGWGWGYMDPTPAGANLVQYNYVHDIMQQRTDGGGVYTLGSQPGTAIDSNLIADNPGPPGGIYLDEGSDGITLTNNVVFGEGVAAPYFLTPQPIFFNLACHTLGCPSNGNTVDNSSAALPPAGLQANYRNLVN